MALGAIAIYIVITQLIQRRYLKTLTEEEFKEGYRKAQLIDVREPDEFDRGHILGARNIPLTQMRTRKQEIRTDKPVYIYCQNSFRCARAASTLHKLGCKDINQLQGGFRKWGGRIKKKN
ncbi:rhodanese-like domain-containing protein [Bacillus solimangrovi]|uniref:rhodanese-like domain-containing protein n=1 Tax=Bacillus solimangrovi TaxID=1305675 RepID=UPI003CCC1BCA